MMILLWESRIVNRIGLTCKKCETSNKTSNWSEVAWVKDLKRARLGWICRVELHNKFGSMSKLGSKDPGSFFISATIPCPMDKYNSLQAQCWLSILESRISEISNSGLSLTMIGRGGGWTQLGIRFRVAGSNIEMWKTRCTVWRLSRSHRMMEWVLGSARISYGPRNLSDSFLKVMYTEELSLDVNMASNLEFQSQ